MSTLRVGLIGAGVMGDHHATALRSLPEATLVAVADRDDVKARRLAAAFDATPYPDYDQMLGKGGLDAVIIATSDSAHRDPCVAAARAGVHILVEKPLATTLEDCDAIAAAAHETGVKVLVGHTLRWEPRYALAQEAVVKGDIGLVSYIFARRNNIAAVARRAAATTNVARFLAVHDVDWIQWVLGEQAASVVARTSNRVLTELDTPDVFFLLLRFPSGALACVEAGWILPEGGSAMLDFQAEALGSKGALYISVQDQGLRVDAAGGLRFPDILYLPVVRGSAQGVYVEELRHFVEVVRTDTPPLCTIAEGRAAVAAILAAEESAASGREIDIA